MSLANSTVEIRIHREMKLCAKNKSKELIIEPAVDGDIYKWKAILRPSDASIYHDTDLEIVIEIPNEYPYEPPRMQFVTPIFHPNINSSGHICISTLGKDWSAALTIEKTLYSILSFLDEPNPEDPLRPDAAELFVCNPEEYSKRVREVCDAAMESKRKEN